LNAEGEGKTVPKGKDTTSDEDQRASLKSLIYLAEKTFETSASVLDQTRRLSKHSSDTASKAKEWKLKLVDETIKVDKVFRDLIEFLKETEGKTRSFENNLKKSNAARESFEKLDDVFHGLEQMHAPKWMTGAEEDKSLLHFVDQEGVKRLRTKAEKLVKRWNDLVKIRSIGILESIKQDVQKICDSAAAVSFEDKKLAQIEARKLDSGETALFLSARSSFQAWTKNMDRWLVSQQESVSKASSLSRQAAACCDRLLTLRNGNIEIGSAERESLEQDEAWLKKCGDELHSLLSSVAQSTKNINERAKKLSASKNKLASSFIPILTSINKKIDTESRLSVKEIEQEIERTENETQDLVDELDQLCVFYYEFQNSFVTIKPEIQRRWSVLAEIEALARKQEEQLNELVQLEIEMRTEYHRDKGAFLPSELCSCLTPDLVNFPTTFKYVVANPEDAQLLHACISEMEHLEPKGESHREPDS